MPNLHRGEVAVTLAGRTYPLCLTLGALAELEAAFGVADLAALGERFATGRLSARDLIRLLGAGLRGGGADLADEAVARLALAEGLEPALHAIAAMLAATFGTGKGGEDPTLPPPLPPG